MDYNNPIDAVITWVDGNDPLHQKKITEALSLEKSKRLYIGSSKYKQIGEIYFCVLSILKFAPFIRNIFIVSDSQVPEFIKKDSLNNPRIKIVDHKEIFKGLLGFTPTFNPRCIDALLYRIPGLSERFISFNDDMFLIQKTKKEDWFEGGVTPVLRGKWSTSYNNLWYKKAASFLFPFLKKRPSYNLAQSLSANMVGYNKKYYRSFHSGRPLLKSILRDYFKLNPKTLHNQLKYRFRHQNQFMPYSLGWHLMIKNRGAALKSTLGLEEITNIKRLSIGKFKILLKKAHQDPAIFSLNIQDLNLGKKNIQDYFKAWMFELLKEV